MSRAKPDEWWLPLDIAEIGWNGRGFTDLSEAPIRFLFKLYAWEWLLREAFGPYLLTDTIGMVEPPWKMLLLNKAILPILWEMFPGHPNLLPAARQRKAIVGACVEKPIHGREGAGIRRVGERERVVDPPDRIYQAAAPLPQFEGWHALIGSSVMPARRPASVCARTATRSPATPAVSCPSFLGNLATRRQRDRNPMTEAATDAKTVSRTTTLHFDVVIVGAGISGVGAACSPDETVPRHALCRPRSARQLRRHLAHPPLSGDPLGQRPLRLRLHRFKPWTGPPIATGAEILRYMGEVIDENDLAGTSATGTGLLRRAGRAATISGRSRRPGPTPGGGSASPATSSGCARAITGTARATRPNGRGWRN